jgi:hypothetical protein
MEGLKRQRVGDRESGTRCASATRAMRNSFHFMGGMASVPSHFSPCYGWKNRWSDGTEAVPPGLVAEDHAL